MNIIQALLCLIDTDIEKVFSDQLLAKTNSLPIDYLTNNLHTAKLSKYGSARSLSENREPTVENLFRPLFPNKFVK